MNFKRKTLKKDILKKMPHFVSSISIKGTISPTITFYVNVKSKLDYIRFTVFHVKLKFHGMDEIKVYLRDIDATHSMAVFMNIMQHKEHFKCEYNLTDEFLDFVENAFKESMLRIETKDNGSESIKIGYCIHIYNNVK